MASTNERIEYMCSHCGQMVIRAKSLGRPNPGKCPRKTGNKPHTWVVNRRLK